MLRSTFALAALAFAVGAPAASAAELTLVATVDTAYCASSGVQCTVAGSGHTTAEASSANHNPVRLLVQVSAAGAPVGALTVSNFVISNSFVPAGGGSASVCSEAKCGTLRIQGSTGIYSIFLDRTSAGNWKAGTYGGIIRVNRGTDTGSTLLTFTIR